MSEAPKKTGPEEDRYGSLFKNMPEGSAAHEIVTDRDGRPVDYRFLDINPAFEKLTGLRREEVMGRLVTEVLPGIEPFWIETYGRVALTGEPASFERYFPQPLDRWYQVYAYRSAPGHFAVIFLDITRRKRAEDALRLSEERFRIIASSTPDHLLVQDRDLRYTMVVNPQLGLTEKDMLGRTDHEFLSNEDADKLTAIKRKLLETGKPIHVEVPLTSRRGQPGVFEGTYVPKFDAQGRIDGLIGYFQNVTERRRAEGLIEQQDQQLREARELLEAVTEGTEVLIATVDSELRYTFFNRRHHEELKRLTGKETRIGLSLTEALADMPEERDKAIAIWSRALKGETVEEILEFGDPRCYRRWYSTRHAPIRNAAGEVVGAGEVTSDITEFMRTQRALEESETRYRSLFEAMQDAVALFEFLPASSDHPADLRFLAVNSVAERWLGTSRDKVIGRTVRQFLPGIDEQSLLTIGKVGLSGQPIVVEGRSPALDRWIGLNAYSPVAGQVVAILSDITARKQAEAELTENRNKYQALIETTNDFIWELDAQGKYTYCSPQMARLWGFEPKQMVGKSPFEMMPPEARDAGRTTFLDLAAAARPFSGLEVPSLDARGHLIFIEISGVPFFDDKGRLLGFRGITRDITERRKAQEESRESEKRLARAEEMAHLGSWEMDHAANRLYWSDETYRIFGLRPQEFGASYEAFLKTVHPDDRKMADETFTTSLRDGSDKEQIEYRIVRPDNGETRSIQSRYEHSRDASGRVIRTNGAVLDITEPVRAAALRQALAEQERLRLGAAVEQASDAVIMIDLDGTIRYVNAAFESINSRGRESAIGSSYFDLLGADEAAEAACGAVISGQPWHGQLTRTVEGGRQVDLEVTVSPALDPANKVIGGLVTEKDVTEENALQRQVRQSQKMEALGTLAGGITHDFNNILGAIIINSELALLDVETQSPLRRPLSLVLQAANRGKELVKQIITFSRQREWERRPIEVGGVVREALKFMGATLPKNIVVQESIASDSGTILGDPSQVHQIVVNLSSNAALAMMDRGGTLTVRLEPVTVDTNMIIRHPELALGRYVLLTVADTGCGMTREVMDRIFEPFFTTRPRGQGSGLGLPVVHGITRAYNGLITVTSEPGRGSIFRVYLPAVEGRAEEAPEEQPLETAGTERILFVEDESDQRASLTRSLKKLGYNVAARASGRAALAAFRKDPKAVDLVITDQLMSGMTGMELAAALVKVRPDIPIILCTGFSEQVDGTTVGRNGIRDLIMKPFTLQDITKLIAKVLGDGKA